MIQFAIAAVLIFVLTFGVGFILNMLLKTTWMPIYAYVLLVLFLIYKDWDEGTVWNHLIGYTYVDIITFIAGWVGAGISGWTIRALRNKGYKMF